MINMFIKGRLDYRVRDPVFYGSLRKSTGANGSKRSSMNTYRKFVLLLQRSPKISGNIKEFTGECNLGILYSSSLLYVYRELIALALVSSVLKFRVSVVPQQREDH